jgi:RNA polymerase sigma-70 factor, ECF subfamily
MTVSPPVGVIPLGAENQRDDSEATLVQRAQRGDEQAFATLYQLHNKPVYSVCLRMTKDVAEAEDLTQEAFIQAFRNLNSFRGGSTFSTLAVPGCRGHRIDEVAPEIPTEPISRNSPSLKREFEKEDLNLRGAIDRIVLSHAIEELPRGCRQIFELHEVEGYEHHEIAEQLQYSIGNSKLQLHKAKMKMRALLFPQRNQANRADPRATVTPPARSKAA